MLEDLNATGEELWIEYTATFRPTALKYVSGPQQLSWTKFIRKNGVFVEQKRSFPKWRGLTDCIEASSFPRLNTVTAPSGASPSNYRNTNPSQPPVVGNTNQQPNSNRRSNAPPASPQA